MKQTVLNLTLFLCIGVVLVFLGCVNSAKRGPEPSPAPGPIPDTTGIFTPGAETTDSRGSYILEPPLDGTDGFLYTIGIGESLDLNIARSMAVQRARTAMAQKAQSAVVALSEDFQQQIRTNARVRIDTVFRQISRSIAAATLIGTTILKTEVTGIDGLYRIQLILGLPIAANIEEPIIEEINQDDALYQDYQAWAGPSGLAEKISDLHKLEKQ